LTGGGIGKGRVEAFSDGVLAVIITIMVLELHAPHSAELPALLEDAPAFLAYVLSFIFIGIYWNNHHHLFQSVQRVDGGILWANNFLLFCLSLVPFSTDWMGENHFALWPVVIYGLVLLLAGIAFFLVAHQLVRLHGADSTLARALGRDLKGWASPILCILGIACAFIHPYLACGIYASVAVMWLIPDRRIERLLGRAER
jgi:uncharacterized membrane protein